METLFNCSLWGDEAFSALLAQKPLWPMLKIVAKDTSPPLFYLISFFWFRIFGASEISIRTLSFLFYSAGMITVALIARRLFGKRAALLSALLTFFNPFLFPYAFEGRMYFSLLFFTLLSFYFLIKQNQWGYILATTAALYSHHFAFFILPPQFLWQTIEWLRKKEKRGKFWYLLKPYLIIGLFYLPWLYPLYQQTSLVASGFWLGKPTLNNLFHLFLNFLRNQPPFSWGRFIPLLSLLLLVGRKWKNKTFSSDLLLLFWILLPPLITFLISQTSLSIFYERYLLFSLPPLMILLSSKIRKLFFPFWLLLWVSYFLISYHHFTHPFKKPFRQFAQLVKEEQRKEPFFLVNYNGQAHHLWESKYYHLNAPLYSPQGKLPFFVGTAQMTDEDIVTHLPQQPVGLITSDPPETIKIKGYRQETVYTLDSLSLVILTPFSHEKE